MTEATGDNTTMLESDPMDMDEVEAKSPEDLTKTEARFLIASKIALNRDPESAFDKRESNIIHRYTTGRFYARPVRVRSRDGPSVYEVRKSLAKKLNLNTYLERLQWKDEEGGGGKPDVQFSARALRKLAAIACNTSGLQFIPSDEARAQREATVDSVEDEYDFSARNINEKFEYEKGEEDDDE